MHKTPDCSRDLTYTHTEEYDTHVECRNAIERARMLRQEVEEILFEERLQGNSCYAAVKRSPKTSWIRNYLNKRQRDIDQLASQ